MVWSRTMNRSASSRSSPAHNVAPLCELASDAGFFLISAVFSSSDRKIRTYNFPQNRVTDDRISSTLHQLTGLMDGKLAPLVDGLVSHYESQRLQQELASA